MFKLFSVFAVILSISACATNQKPGTESGGTAPESDTAVADRTHHLACRGTPDAHVQELLNAAFEKKGVILYFHGGMSGQDYMEKTLGPWLENSIFAEPNMQEFYPVFVNYDAGLFEWNNVLSQLDEFVKSEAGKRAVSNFEGGFPYTRTNGQQNKPETQAREYLKSALGNKNRRAKSTEEELENDYVRILQDDEFAKQAGAKLNEQERFRAITDNVASFTNMQLEKSEPRKRILNKQAGIVVARALARIALGSNHQIVPTFLEEVLSVLYIGPIKPKDIAVNHWKLVKDHAEECFAMGSAGRYFIDQLLSKRAKEPAFQIHTISHSAGSIPTGQLAAYFSGNKQHINSSHLIVPAVNQADFQSLYINHRNGIDKLRLYVLDEHAEETDGLEVKNFTVYPASLLYFVSGAAENVWYNDKMLLIAQHLRNDKRPYKWPMYRIVTKEDPLPVLNYFSNPDHQGELLFYPGDFGESAASGYKRSARHECTKYPWVASAIALNIVKEITGKQSNGIPVPQDEKARAVSQSSCM